MPAVALRIVSLVGLALAVRATPAIAELRVYEARHRPAAELLPLARTALGGEGAATVDARTQTLVLTGPGAVLTRTLELLRSMDRRLRTVVLRYVSVGHEEMEAAGLRVEWSVELGDARIGTLPAGARLALGFEVAHAAATPRLAATLRLLEGHRGRLSFGQAAPVRFHAGEVLTAADSGFEVRPRVLSDGRVRLELAPFEARLHGAGIDSFAAVTQVELEPGRTFVVARVAEGRDTRESRRLVGKAERARSRERVLVVAVELQ